MEQRAVQGKSLDGVSEAPCRQPKRSRNFADKDHLLNIHEVAASSPGGRLAQAKLQEGTLTYKQRTAEFETSTKGTEADRLLVGASPKRKGKVKSHRTK